MKTVTKIACCVGLALSATFANAGIIDFVDIIDVEGEKGTALFDHTDTSNAVYTSNFLAGDLEITANGGSKFVYGDAPSGGTIAGLGVCSVLTGSAQCNPSSDDNLSIGEFLSFTFGNSVKVTNIWINNNHDGNFSDGDAFSFAHSGAAYTDYIINAGVLTGGALTHANMLDPTYSIIGLLGGEFTLAAGNSFDFGFAGGANEPAQYYISAIEFTAVPEPGSLALFGLGAIGIAVASKRRKIAVKS